MAHAVASDRELLSCTHAENNREHLIATRLKPWFYDRECCVYYDPTAEICCLVDRLIYFLPKNNAHKIGKTQVDGSCYYGGP